MLPTQKMVKFRNLLNIFSMLIVPTNVFNKNILKTISVSKSAADTLLKYRCIWDNEMPIITNTPSIVDSPNDISASESKGTSSESKGTALLPDSSIFTLFLVLVLRKICLLNIVNFKK